MNGGPLTVREILARSSSYLAKAGVPSARLEAELLLGHVLGLDRTQLYVQYDRPLVPPETDRLRALLLARAKERVPTTYLIGRKFFLGHELHIPRGVFIPRPETEELAVLAVSRLSAMAGDPSLEILDLCTGSGALLVAMAKSLPVARLLGVDLSPLAVEAAMINLQRHQLTERVAIRQGDLWAAVEPARAFAAIVANPPYIPSGDCPGLQAEVRHEPLAALDGGPDGLELCRRILAEAADHLLPGGFIAMEHGADQGEALLALAAQSCLAKAAIYKDLSGRPRFLIAEKH